MRDGTLQRLFTIGHSARTFEAFRTLLRAHGIAQLADVRAVPASRRFPHFNRASLETTLPAQGVAYRWFPGLGGHRTASPRPSPNGAWRDGAFRAYADYLATHAFATACAELEAWAAVAATACMCAEADFRRCHRQLLADALVVRGWEVLHLSDGGPPRPHALSPWACVGAEGQITYPALPALPLDPPA